MTFDDFQRKRLVNFDGTDTKILSLLFGSDEWRDLSESDLRIKIKESGKESLYNGIRRGLMLLDLQSKGAKLDRAYFAQHGKDLGLSYAWAKMLMILARSPRTWREDWPHPHKLYAAYLMVRFDPRKTTAGEECHYAIAPDLFEKMVAPSAEGWRIVDHDTTQKQIRDYVNRQRLKPGPRGSTPEPMPVPRDWLNQIVQGDCCDLIKLLPDDSISTVITSPPYAMQRSEDYSSVSESEFPGWFASVMKELWPKMKDDGNVIVVIESNVRDGEESRYVNRTIDAVCDLGWNWCQKLVWNKVNPAPVGNNQRPMKLIADILWFSKSKTPYVDLTVCGKPTKRKGKAGSSKHRYGRSSDIGPGIARIKDIFEVNAADVDDVPQHNALMPPELARRLIRTFCPPGGLIVDPFAGAGTTLLVARSLGRPFVGFEIEKRFVDLINDRLLNDARYKVNTSAIGR